jgi:hypothetical protein
VHAGTAEPSQAAEVFHMRQVRRSRVDAAVTQQTNLRRLNITITTSFTGGLTPCRVGPAVHMRRLCSSLFSLAPILSEQRFFLAQPQACDGSSGDDASFTCRLLYYIEIEGRASLGSKAGELNVITVKLTVETGVCRKKFRSLAMLACVSCMQKYGTNVSLNVRQLR